MGFQCDSEDGNDAVVLMTQIGSEDGPLAYCEVCWPAMVRVMADTMSVAEVTGGTITDGQLMELASGRLQVIDTIKATNPVKQGRREELETMVRALGSILHDEPMPEGTLPSGEPDGSEDEDQAEAGEPVEQAAVEPIDTWADELVGAPDLDKPPF